jgi:hypothetical protein
MADSNYPMEVNLIDLNGCLDILSVVAVNFLNESDK